jgi:rhodanese-related sulfurtransferase
MRKFLFLIMIIGLGVTSTAFAGKDEGFPARKDFPKVPVISLKDLYHKLRDVVLVDARSTLEYKTLRMVKAINIPVAKEDFEDRVKKLRRSTDKTIVFYCNGRTCHKSYIATKKAMEAGVKNVIAYDAGIFEWATAHPDKAILLGKTPINVKSLISKRYYKTKLLDPDTFSEKILETGSSSMVLDVRDKFQRAGVGFYPGKERWCSLDEKTKLARYLEKAKESKRTLFIYDEVGKQVVWLQYTLEKMGIKNYYFMKKGATGYYKTISYWKK